MKSRFGPNIRPKYQGILAKGMVITKQITNMIGYLNFFFSTIPQARRFEIWLQLSPSGDSGLVGGPLTKRKKAPHRDSGSCAARTTHQVRPLALAKHPECNEWAAERRE